MRNSRHDYYEDYAKDEQMLDLLLYRAGAHPNTGEPTTTGTVEAASLSQAMPPVTDHH
jgi:hypothetical protein